MTVATPTDTHPFLTAQPGVVTDHPRYEGANIRTWIGFKHFMYLAEEAVLQYFRDRGFGAGRLFQEFGLGLEVIDSSVQLPHVLMLDDDVVATARPADRQRPGAASFVVQLAIRPKNGGDDVLALKGKLQVALIREEVAEAPQEIPADLAGFVRDELHHEEATTLTIPPGSTAAEMLSPAGSNAFVTSHRAPYYHCHFSDRVQSSAYIRELESVVDDFLHARGLAVGDLLRDRAWIPVVSRARVRMLAAAHMEETLYTVLTVQDILRDTTYTATMDCWAERDGVLVKVTTGTIMHGYAISRGPGAGSVAVLDEQTQDALLHGGQ